MNFSEKEIKNLRIYLFRYALHLSNSYDTAEDLCQIALVKLIESDNIKNPIAWATTVLKREFISRWKEKKRHEVLKRDLLRIDNLKIEKYLKPSLTADEIKYVLDSKDYEIYKLYLKYDGNLKKMITKTLDSYNVMKTKTYRMRFNLRAAFAKKNGSKSKSSLNFKQYRNIYIFIRTLIKNVNENKEITSMTKYFNSVPQYVPDLTNVKKNLNFEIHKLDIENYHLIVLSTTGSLSDLKVWGVQFHFNKPNKLRVDNFIKDINLHEKVDTSNKNLLRNNYLVNYFISGIEYTINC